MYKIILNVKIKVLFASSKDLRLRVFLVLSFTTYNNKGVFAHILF